jgi:hypothetical protein
MPLVFSKLQDGQRMDGPVGPKHRRPAAYADSMNSGIGTQPSCPGEAPQGVVASLLRGFAITERRPRNRARG